jgi:uncharacterized protein YndB with AHSA1/START domain
VTEPGEKSVSMRRTFDAPAVRVFDAMTKPELLRKWYAAPGIELTVCESELRVGGAFHIVQRAPNGFEFGFRGVYREYVRPERRVYTWIFDAMPDKETVITETFEERSGTTYFTSTMLFQSNEDREGFLSMGAKDGGDEHYDRLDELLATAHDDARQRS